MYCNFIEQRQFSSFKREGECVPTNLILMVIMHFSDNEHIATNYSRFILMYRVTVEAMSEV